MSELYRKRGRVVRYDNGFFVHVVEAGESIETADSFTCAPLRQSVAMPEIDRNEVEETVREIRAAVSHPLSIERMIVSRGIAEHEFGSERWTEESRRVHLSITFGAMRALFDLADFALHDVRRAIGFLPRAREERESPQRLRLAPPVSAALLPSLVGVAPPNVTLWQVSGERDGKGQPIHETRIGTPPWPNWYRPSYRVRPVRAPHNLRLQCDVQEIDCNVPEAVALLAPVDGLTMRVLCVDGGSVYPATVRINRIDAAAEPTQWYPYGAGSFGAALECGG
jgi:hypothetical protein